jgi:hypothetical protein
VLEQHGELASGVVLLPMTTRAPWFPAGLRTVAFSSAIHDTFAIITRTGTRLSPGVGELLTGLESHMRAIAEDLDRYR